MNAVQADLEILAGYRQPPFFFDDRQREFLNHTLAETAEFFQFSSALVTELAAWDSECQATMNIDEPQDAGFSSDAAYQARLRKGAALAVRIKNEATNIGRVGYQTDSEFERGADAL
ncbi:hypothetical protein [Actinoalloteichus hymeniacidonis]|uniref:Uncharacterized protein n=1 Tax=Actinoalloteichus hymeniacidonis TaxID=340345 RepID=A0AAC9MW95_9PSEU|nr:hypothetical protein [Actinoalloteichus hymeniacidonis]AOS61050.1 hypothetical protein TL08_01030 [Actinoalloteichus hymeniacidonis]MBB5910950.1 hypothetical protein [Actinoalloteichus hymeniacidonis]